MSLYRQSFGLTKDPFNMTPDPELLFMTEQHREALAGLAYSILHRGGFTVLIGPAGTGKTTLVTTVLRSLGRSVQSCVILNPALNAEELLEMALLDFGITEVPASKAQRISRIHKLLMDWHDQGKTVVLIVDEAHKLSPEVLEEIRLWSNFEFPDKKLLQIVLVGQPELRDVLNRADLQQLKQRIALRLTISPLAPADVAAYIRHRWSKAGAPAPMPATPEAVELIARASGGIPRVINAICDNALLHVYGRGLAVMAVEHVQTACRDLDLAVETVPVLDPPAPKEELVAVGAKPHLNGHSAHLSEALPKALPPPSDDFAPLRTLSSLTPKPKRSLWNRLVGKNGKV
jgi:general secretion pathway protein A